MNVRTLAAGALFGLTALLSLSAAGLAAAAPSCTTLDVFVASDQAKVDTDPQTAPLHLQLRAAQKLTGDALLKLTAVVARAMTDGSGKAGGAEGQASPAEVDLLEAKFPDGRVAPLYNLVYFDKSGCETGHVFADKDLVDKVLSVIQPST